MNISGYSLFELIATLCVTTITLAIGIPSFLDLKQKSQLENTYKLLLDSIQLARTQAVIQNQRTILIANENWSQGWQLFVDSNKNGTLDPNEQILLKQPDQPHARIISSNPVSSHIAFIGTGEGVQLNSGGFLAGNIKVCPRLNGEGYKLVLSRGGRVRMERLSSAACKATLDT